MYIGVNNDGRFVFGQLGMGLVEGRCLKNVLGYLIRIRLFLLDVNVMYRVKKDRIIVIQYFRLVSLYQVLIYYI